MPAGKPLFSATIMKALIAACSLVLVCSFFACDEIGMPYEKTTTTGPVDTTKVIKKVLLEEYTGQTCTNCPNGHRIAASIKAVYGDRMITMAIHSGGFAEPDPPKYPNDFRTAAGNTLNATFGLSSYPSGVINRSQISGQFVQSTAAWSSDVANAMNDTAYVKLELSSVYTAASGDVAITVKTTALKNFTTTKALNVALYVVEDSVIAPQLDGSAIVTNYVHRDMLRDSPLGAFGTEFMPGTTVAANTVTTQTFHTSISGKTWNVGHLKIVGIVCEKDPTYIIWQAEEVKLAL